MAQWEFDEMKDLGYWYDSFHKQHNNLQASLEALWVDFNTAANEVIKLSHYDWTCQMMPIYLLYSHPDVLTGLQSTQ